MKKVLQNGAVALGSVTVASQASAADWSTLTTGLSFSGEETAIIAITGVLFSFYVVKKGATMLLGMLDR